MSYTVTTADLPSSRPSLNLNFAQAGVLDPRITFTRASTGTYYDGVTFAKAEENLLLQSQDFSTTWANLASTDTANSTAAPDGTTTADTLTESATSNIHGIVQGGVSVISGTTYAFSIFIKKGTGATAPDVIQLTWATSGFTSNVYVNYDISVGGGSSGTVTQAGASVISSSITDVGNGWYRCTFTANAGSTTTSGMTVLFTNNNPTATRAPSYLGVVTADAFLWGAQLEQRSAVTDYTATTTQPITSYVPALQTAASGEARFDHDPLTGESLGFLIEEQRTNLLTYSEDLSNAAWSITGTASIGTNTVVAPDGTLTADKFVLGDTITSGNAAVYQTVTKSAVATTYTVSLYIKAGEFNTLRLIFRDTASAANSVQAYFNAATGVIASGPTAAGTFTNASATITPVGNGWYRCTLTGTTSTETSVNTRIFNYQDGTGTATGNGYSGIYIWGAQLEAGAFPTSYIKTVASQATRNADAASMTGTNFSEWFNPSAGAVYAESSTMDFSASRGVWAIGNTSLAFSSGYMIYETYTASVSGRRTIGVFYNGSSQAPNLGTAVSQSENTFSPGAFAYALDDLGQSTNGATAATDTSGLLPIGVTGFSIGSLISGWAGAGNYLNGHIRKLAYYPKRLSNATLQALTEE
jgi:hypothetical protein